jgi:hypothetical protein
VQVTQYKTLLLYRGKAEQLDSFETDYFC